jgi:hypothetical protein
VVEHCLTKGSFCSHKKPAGRLQVFLFKDGVDALICTKKGKIKGSENIVFKTFYRFLHFQGSKGGC